MFEILPRDWNLKPIFTQKWGSVDKNWGFNPTPQQFQPWTQDLTEATMVHCNVVRRLKCTINITDRFYRFPLECQCWNQWRQVKTGKKISACTPFFPSLLSSPSYPSPPQSHRPLLLSTLPDRQSAQMSKITNDCYCLTPSGAQDAL